MSRALQFELFKARRRRMTWILLGVSPAVIACFYALICASVADGSSTGGQAEKWEAMLRADNLVTFADAVVFRVVALLAVIAAGTSVAGEFSSRTIVTVSAWTGDRRKVVAGKLAAAGVLALALTLGAWLAVVVAVVAWNVGQGTLHTVESPLQMAGSVAVAVAETWAIACVYAVVAVGIGWWTRSAAAAIAIPLAVLLLEPLGVAVFNSLGGTASAAMDLTLSHNIDGVLASNGAIKGTGESLSGYPSAFQGAIYLATFAGITAWLTLHSAAWRDVIE